MCFLMIYVGINTYGQKISNCTWKISSVLQFVILHLFQLGFYDYLLHILTFSDVHLNGHIDAMHKPVHSI